MRKYLRTIRTFFRFIIHFRAERVFCISMQRTGTSSVGRFFKDFGYVRTNWKISHQNGWPDAWYEGNYEKIFSSIAFRSANAYEDSPFFYPDFYKVLFHRFPGAKFILFTRNPDAWFQSMLKHSNGNILGRSRIHCKIYGREEEYFQLLGSGNFDEAVENQIETEKTMKLYGHEEHYKHMYDLYNREVKAFFGRNSPNSLHIGTLEDPDKWQKLGKFLGVKVPAGYDAHVSKS